MHKRKFLAIFWNAWKMEEFSELCCSHIVMCLFPNNFKKGRCPFLKLFGKRQMTMWLYLLLVNESTNILMHLVLIKRQFPKIELFNQHHPAYEIHRHSQKYCFDFAWMYNVTYRLGRFFSNSCANTCNIEVTGVRIKLWLRMLSACTQHKNNEEVSVSNCLCRNHCNVMQHVLMCQYPIKPDWLGEKKEWCNNFPQTCSHQSIVSFPSI